MSSAQGSEGAELSKVCPQREGRQLHSWLRSWGAEGAPPGNDESGQHQGERAGDFSGPKPLRTATQSCRWHSSQLFLPRTLEIGLLGLSLPERTSPASRAPLPPAPNGPQEAVVPSGAGPRWGPSRASSWFQRLVLCLVRWLQPALLWTENSFRLSKAFNNLRRPRPPKGGRWGPWSVG